jgi:polygalacturonase
MRQAATVVAAVLSIALLSGSGATARADSLPARPADWSRGAVSKIEQTAQADTPVFPHRQCDITDPKYASLIRQVTDGAGASIQSVVWYYGDAINAAIADCHTRGGGVVVISASGSRNGAGIYFSGAITLLSKVNLRIDTGATVKFVRNPTNAYYPVVLTSYQGSDFYNYSPLVYALNQTNIALTGGGTLDAQDNVANWQLPAAIPGTPAGTNTVLNDLDYQGVPVDQRIFTDDGHMPATIPVLEGCPPQSRDWGPCTAVRNVPPPAGAVAYHTTFVPQFVEFNHSANILVQGVHLVNTLFWQIHPLNSRNIVVRDANVYDTAHHTDDGIDPESCDNVLIEDNSVTTLDDGIAIKSGRNRDGRVLRAPSEDILIRDNSFYNPTGGSASISIGSEMSGSVYDVFAEGNRSGGNGTAYLLKIKTNSYRGGVVQGVYIRNSTVTQTIRGVVNFDMNYSEGVPFLDADIFNPAIRNIYLNNVNAAPTVATGYPAFVVSSAASRSPIENVSYENSVFYTTSTFPAAFTSTSSRFFENLMIRNVRFINPLTEDTTTYNTAPLRLLDQTTANAGGTTLRLTAASIRQPDVINRLPTDSFTITGKVDLRAFPGFMSGGAVAVFVDRDATGVPVTLNADGSFTSGITTLSNNEYWYINRHYVVVNFYNGINVNTMVYQVAVP